MRPVLAIIALWCLLLGVIPPAARADDAALCDAQVGRWLDPASGETLDGPALYERLAAYDVVLLGEEHDKAEHHRWQADVIAGLLSRRALVLGFEMLPRAAQPVLDAWSAGELDQAGLLERTDWRRVWGFDESLYLPLFHLARLHRLPTVAMNVDRTLVSRVAGEGFDAVPESEREGVSKPAPASADYRGSLARLYARKARMVPGEEPPPDPVTAEEVDAVMEREDFARFVEAQLTWDRAMAEALADASRRHPGTQVVGIAGRGHLEYRHGIPHQLADLGVTAVSVLVPMDAGPGCEPPPRDLADAVFVVDPPRQSELPPPPARLGVLIEPGEGGVLVTRVLEGSVAAQSGLLADDVIDAAAGFDTPSPSALVEVVTRQAPGTWLPLRVRRGGEVLEIVARFPKRFGEVR